MAVRCHTYYVRGNRATLNTMDATVKVADYAQESNLCVLWYRVRWDRVLLREVW